MTEKKIKTIGVLTGGGDAPGMNAAIRAVVRRGLSSGLHAVSYTHLVHTDLYDRLDVIPFDKMEEFFRKYMF